MLVGSIRLATLTGDDIHEAPRVHSMRGASSALMGQKS